MGTSYLLKGTDILKTYGDRSILDISSVELRRGDKIGLVGRNGTGKSTLIAALSGELELDGGRFDRRGVVAVIRQFNEPDSMRETAGGRTGRRFLASSLSEAPSGGELTRAAIDRALAARPDILLADEPTTNLDLDGINRFQAEMASLRGALVLVSHDRDLLDALCGEIWELENGKIRAHPGNYSAWAAQRDRERKYAQLEYDQYRSERRRLTESARKATERASKMLRPLHRMSASEKRLFKGGLLEGQGRVQAKAGSLSRRVEKLEAKERPSDLPEIKMELGMAVRVAADPVIRVEGLRVAFGGRTLLDGVSFDVTTGSRTMLLGPNGSGKSTIIAEIARGSECVKISPDARMGFFDQRHESVALNRTTLENARSMSSKPEHEVRTILARLEIKGDEAHKKCAVLSGGERAKVALAQLIASDINVLIMDEPTNHIDIFTVEALEAMLAAWGGTLLLVTHDRRLAHTIGDRLLIISEGQVLSFEGGVSEYESRNAAQA
jgi:macrolide transport system ATP-binding/permease protein